MMRHPVAACMAGALATLGLAWAVTAFLEQGFSAANGPRFREVSAGEGLRLLGMRGAVLVEVLTPAHVARRVPEAELAFSGGPLPPALAEGAPAVVLLAADPGAGYRMAARLARAGIQDVTVVRGGVEAWRELQLHIATERAPRAGDEQGRPPERTGDRSDGRTG